MDRGQLMEPKSRDRFQVSGAEFGFARIEDHIGSDKLCPDYGGYVGDQNFWHRGADPSAPVSSNTGRSFIPGTSPKGN